jgi:hypothetical protein
MLTRWVLKLRILPCTPGVTMWPTSSISRHRLATGHQDLLNQSDSTDVEVREGFPMVSLDAHELACACRQPVDRSARGPQVQDAIPETPGLR